MDDFDALLLSIVHKGDITALKTQLLTVSNPDVYLNRIYNEPNEQKCTLLMIACLNQYEDMVYMLLDCFKPDLEVLNAIRINDEDKMSELYSDVTVLWAAAAMNYSLIVNRLILHGANINHKTSTNSTPVRGACFNGNVEMVRYLIENGANINVARINNSTNLILSVYRKHLQMTVYLVDILGLDVNECYSDGRSPLYFAIKCGSLEIAQFLLNRGARNFPATYNQLSPIMLAAEKRRSDLVDIISMYCSTIEWIEAEELLGSAFACAEYGDCDLQQSFEHFSRALELRLIHNLPKTLRSATFEIFNNRQECQTIDQLKEIRFNSDNMHIEALLVRERLLGPTSEKYRHSIQYRGAMLADNAQYDRAVAIWLYNLEMQQEYSLTIDRICLRQFSSIFAQMFYESFPISIDGVLTVITAVVAQLKHDVEEFNDNLHTVLFLTTIVSQPSVDVLFSDTDRKIFYQLLYSIHKDRYVTRNDGSSLLHLCLSDDTSASDYWIDRTCKYPCLHTVRTLLKCGANVNEINVVRDTPLHIFAHNRDDCDETILQLLCGAGAHVDCVNALVSPQFNMTDPGISKIVLPIPTAEDYRPIGSTRVTLQRIDYESNTCYPIASNESMQICTGVPSSDKVKGFYQTTMPCSICKNDLPSNNYAVEEGVFLCLPCFLERHRSRDLTQIPCQSCGVLPSMTHRIISDYPRERSRSSVNVTQSRNVSETSTVESSRQLPYLSRTYESTSRRLSLSSEKRKQTCQVCFDEKPSRHFRSISNHKCHQLNRSICDECIYQHIQQAFQNILTDDVRCPELDCGIKYEYDTIKNILHSNDNIKLFNRFDQFLVRLHLEKLDEFIWCSNPKCAMGQLNDGGDSNNIVTCIRCRQKTCFTHKIAWHQGLTCEQYDLTMDNNLQSSLQWITQNTKECPNCHFRIEKNDGCDHMTCIKCQYEFCWACLADFNQIRQDGNHRHDPNCKHYAAYDKA